MANLIAAANNDWTNAATFGVADTTMAKVNGTTSTAVTNSALDSAAYTPGAIEVDGILLNMSRLGTSISGTMTVTLRNSTAGTDVKSVQINNADLPSNFSTGADSPGCWLFFKFDAAVTLVAATNYKVRLISSVTTKAYFYAGASNDWNVLLRTTTTEAAGVGDRIFIQGEYTGAGASTTRTVTLDVDATTEHGQLDISHDGTLIANTAASVEARFAANVHVWADGTLNLTQTDPTYTCWFRFVTGSDGQYGLTSHKGSIITLQGVNKTYWKAKLAADVSALDTNITLDTSVGTNWKSGDEIAFASTTRTASQCEKKTMSGDGSGTGITVAAMTNAHSGSGYSAGEVLNLTRSVKIDASSATQAYISHAGGDWDVDWVEFANLGGSSILGFEFTQTNVGTIDMKYSTMHDYDTSTGYGFRVKADLSASSSCAVQYCGAYNTAYGFQVNVAQSNVTITFDNLVSILAGQYGFVINDAGTTLTYCTAVGATQDGINISESGAVIGTINNLVAHSNGSGGVSLGGLGVSSIGAITAWRNSNGGISINTATPATLTINTATLTGNQNWNISTSSGSSLKLNSVTMDSDAVYTTTTNCYFQSTRADLQSCTLSGTTAATNDFGGSGIIQVYAYNSSFGAATTLLNQTTTNTPNFIRSSRHGGTAGAYKSWGRYGMINNDTVTYKTASPSELCTPNNTTQRLESASKYVALNSGQTATVSAWVRKTAAYDGAQPRLIVKRNDSAGITADTVLDTMTAAVETWEQLSGTTGAVTENCVLEFVVDCIKGTGGAINVDLYEASVT